MNAKNAYGGYTGEQVWVVILEDGKWRDIVQGESSGASVAAMVMDTYKGLAVTAECGLPADNSAGSLS